MSVIFDGPNKAPKVDAYELAKDLSDRSVLQEAVTDISQFQTPNPEFQKAIEWASEALDTGGVKADDIDPSLGEVMRAAFQQENTLGSLVARALPEDDTPSITPEEIYTKAENEGLLPFIENFRGVQTEGEYEATKANLQRELHNRQILDAAGWGGTAAMLGAAVVDPVNFVPVGGAAVRVAKLAARGGKAAVEGALAGAMGAGIAEAGLQATQETRTGAESVVAVAAGTVLGGVLGFGVDAVFGREIADKAAQHYDSVRSGNAKSAGAAAVGDLDRAMDERFANDAKLSSLGINSVYEAIEKLPVVGSYLSSPARVLSRSYSGAARKAMAMLVSDPNISKGNAAGRRSLDNVETAFGRIKGQFGEARSEITNIYNKNKAAYGNSREVFNSRVAHALATGDKSDDAIVERAAKVLRARVFDPIRSSLVESGVFKADEAELLNAESYFPLVYSPDSVRGDEDAFVEFHEAVFSRVIHEEARQALIAKSIRQSDIEDTVISHKGVRQRVPKFEADGVTPVINPKTGKQVMTEKIITKGKFKELRDEAMATFESEAKELRAERDTVLKSFNKGDDWPFAGPSALDNPFQKQFEARDKLREKQAAIDADVKTRKEDENFKHAERLDQINGRAKDKADAGIDKGSTSKARASGKALEKELAQARKEHNAKLKEIDADAAKKRKPLDEELDEQAALIDSHYAERIDTALKSRDEVITAADDTARAAVMKARGVELDDGIDATARNFTRKGAIAEDLIAAEALKRSRSLYAAIVNSADPMVEHEVMGGLRGYTKARKNPADHVTLMSKGWAMSDAMSIADRYTKTAGMDSVLGKFFTRKATKVDSEGAAVIGPNGIPEQVDVADVGLTTVRKRIKDEYDAMIGGAVPENVAAKLREKFKGDATGLDNALKAEKVRHEKALMSRRDTELEALDTLLNFARGRAANPGPQWLRETAEKVGIYNYVRLMGGQIVSSLGDPLNLVISQGLGNTIKHGVLPILRDYKAALRSADGEARRLARLSAANLEMEFNATMAEIGGFTSPWVSQDGLSKWRLLAEKFSTVNGIKHWNTLWKQIAYNVTQSRLIENAAKGWGKASDSERAWMASLGVDEFRLNDFATYFDKQSSKTVAGGMPLARWDEWADKTAGEAFRAAVYKESFNVVITPGLYDKLNAHSNPVGRMILQFRNHMFANTARLTARNVQLATLGMDKAGAAVTGLVGLMMMGVLIDAAKQTLGDITATGDTVSGEGALEQVMQRWQEAPVQQLYNVNDRIGWLGPAFEASNVLHGTAGMGLQDLLRVVSGEESIGTSRLGQRSMLDVAGGATAGLLSDTVAAVKSVGAAALSDEKDLSLSDVKRMERLGLPMTLPYLRPFINEFNQYVGTQYDWPTSR